MQRLVSFANRTEKAILALAVGFIVGCLGVYVGVEVFSPTDKTSLPQYGIYGITKDGGYTSEIWKSRFVAMESSNDPELCGTGSSFIDGESIETQFCNVKVMNEEGEWRRLTFGWVNETPGSWKYDLPEFEEGAILESIHRQGYDEFIWLSLNCNACYLSVLEDAPSNN